MYPVRLRYAGIAGGTACIGRNPAVGDSRGPPGRADATGQRGACTGRVRTGDCGADCECNGSGDRQRHDQWRCPLDRDQRRAALDRPAGPFGRRGTSPPLDRRRDGSGRPVGLRHLGGARAFDGEHHEQGTDRCKLPGAQHGAAGLHA